VATIPDPTISEVETDEELKRAVRAFWRRPYRPLWGAVLKTLHTHRAEVAELAPDLTAKVCQLWLQFSSSGARGRKEAAEIAVGMAQAVHGGKTNSGRRGVAEEPKHQEVLEAALWAASELPDEVSTLALQLARRQGEPSADASSPAGAMRPNSGADPVFLPPRVGRRWPRVPDGPRERVDVTLQTTVLTTNALAGLIRGRPQVAREVLLACCLKEPGRIQDARSLGTVERFSRPGSAGAAAMYFQGPFLSFLWGDPGEGLETILRLVNQATANWAALQEGEARGLVPWAEMDRWIGDQEVYAWYRGHGSAVVLASALMALEKWLYDRVDAQEDVGPAIRRIFAGSRSVSLAGVLVALAKKHPELLQNELDPLLSAWPLYRWDAAVTEREEYRFDLPDLFHLGASLYEVARQWHIMAHRRQDLLSLVVDLFLAKPEIREGFESIRARWGTLLVGEQLGSSRELRELIAVFDPGNHHREERPDGSIEWTFTWPESLLEANRDPLAAAETIRIRALALEERCQSLLAERGALPAQMSERIWQELHALEQMVDEGTCDSRLAAYAICTGTAALLSRAREWMDEDPSRRLWCRERLVPMVIDLRCAETDGTLPGLVRWPLSAAVAGVALLAGDLEDVSVRQIVARLIVHWREGVAQVALEQAFRERSELRDDWSRIRNLTIRQAALRSIGRPQGAGEMDLLGRWASRLERWFVERKIPARSLSWERLGLLARRIRNRLHEREERNRVDEFEPQEFFPLMESHPGLDLPTLQAAFDWLPRLAVAAGVGEREEWIDLHRELLEVALRMRQRIDEESGQVADIVESWTEGLLSEYQRWLFPRLARLIPQLRTAEERRGVWEPILGESGRSAFRSVESFLMIWFSEGTSAADDPEVFVECWGEMIDYGLALTDSAFETVELMGLRWGAAVIGREEYRLALRKLLPLFERWANEDLAAPQAAEHLARFLVRPAARDFLCPALLWMQPVMHAWEVGSAEIRAELREGLTRFLDVCWRYEGHRVRDKGNLKDAFLELLGWVAQGGDATALELRERVRQAL